ncbi:tRNA(Ile)-lysidine synthetase [Mycoplasmopsis meleagridis]|uniref:tRNA(Ile)-lysidine synthase n=1 Tax=Mycoplasmopsis meleagridis ATCC 25294 TaxID=1264554 RepID=A0A0F5H0P3_9BACT|nr:tRNA lysidine(34) synthetase TilS [Mycoplasmopsis meleagridis]KKB26695.1 tRNA(Ile)-lysidine synthetase [Mycoplasmopsis meleagridis ATCC 25294]OAD18189.1 tRNA(Ile)-lysidine synthetase [Mycoplasmopsis meleagridis]VEU77750.1 tRNA(Ile)-lysidine synthase [Mycoplasmopsis meleagridis]
MSIKRKKIILAVSGGPDSMFLLNWALKRNKRANLIVCSVNYNYRENSNHDITLVKNFCLKNNLILKIKNIDFQNDNNYKKNNFENQARNDRYAFFKEQYDKFNAKKILTAHHKDDFIETALMQEKTKRKLFFYGIKKKNFINNMNIFRPFVNKYYKDQIIKKCKRKNIVFALDYSNYLESYTRNAIRNDLLVLNIKEKEKLFKKFLKMNRDNKKNEKNVENELEIWKKNNFSQDIFVKLTDKIGILYKFLYTKFPGVKLNSRKINSIIDFIVSSNRTSKYKLNDHQYLVKNKGNIM